jgi:hypothetical protein
MTNKFLSKIKNNLENDSWYRIAFLGDSITSAEWVHPNWREIIEYILKMELEKMLGDINIPWWKMRFYNAGFCGDHTGHLLGYLDEELAPIRPDLVIFMDTYNDKYFDISPLEHGRNLELIFFRLSEFCENIVFSSSIKRLKPKANELNDPYRREAERIIKNSKSNISYVDLYSQFEKLNLSRFFTFINTPEDENKEFGVIAGEIDFSHPNVFGNAHIAKIFLNDIFGVEFDPEIYLKGVLKGEKYPRY